MQSLQSRAQTLRPHTQARQQLVVVAAVKAKSIKQVCCSKTLVAKPEHIDDVFKLCQNVAAFTAQRAKDKDSGIVETTCSKDMYEDNVFHFWERYQSNVLLGRHNTTPEMKLFFEQVQPFLERPVGMALYEYQNGKIGSLCVQEGPKGEGGLDDATGASGAAGGASMKQTSSTVDLTQVNEQEDEDLLHSMQSAAAGFKSMFSKILGKK